MSSKWKVSRKEYKGKNCLGEKIYHVYSIKTVKRKIDNHAIDVVVDHKMEVLLESSSSYKILKNAAIMVGLADSYKTLIKHRKLMVKFLKNNGHVKEANQIVHWSAQDLLDFRNEVGI